MKKNFIKNLLAVAAVMATASCAKEAIQDANENPATDPVQGKCFTAVFEEVKSTLNGDRYPEWVEGDAIGVTTSEDANVECTKIEGRNAFNAEGLQGPAPFYAVYPYSTGNTFEGGVLYATVPTTQQLGQGQNVAPGALVAACKSENYTLNFKNCVSLMQIEIPIENVKKVKVQATTAGEKLSGAFTMNLEELNPAAATEGAEDYVELLPSGESFAIGTYYISVIPGTIKAVKITFTNTEDKEVSVSKSASTTFARSNGINMGSFFKYEISTADELIKWAAQNAKYTAWDVVELKADITLTAEQAAKYVEAHEFKGVFDGKNHKISGLKTPLFGNLRGAIVKDIEIEANIVSNGKQASPFKGTDYGVGILAHYTYPDQGQASPVLSNIKTYGSIEVKELNVTHNFMFGGVVGASNGTPLVDCENNATVTFTSGTTGSATLNIGGVIGAAQNTTTSDLTNCVNKGKVTLAGFSGTSSPVAAGCVGLITQAVEINNCSNEAEVEVASTVGNISFIVAGLAGNFTGAATVAGCENSGAVNVNAPAGKYLVIGGLVGSLKPDAAVVKNSENKGVVTVNTNAANRSDVGGVIAYTGSGSDGGKAGGYYVQKVTNSGNIVVNGTSGSSTDQFRIGGIIGNLSYGGIIGKDKDGNDTPCYNKANITVKSPQTKHIRIAGGIGSTTNVKTNVYNIHNTGNITIEITDGKTCAQVDCGGIVGYLGTGPFVIADCSSKCVTSKSGTITNNYFATVLGRTATGTTGNTISDCSVGGTLVGTVITTDNVNDNVYANKATSTGLTVSNITLAE